MDETGDKCINNRFSYNDAADQGVSIQCKSIHLQNLCPRHFHPNFHKRHIAHISLMFNSHDHLKKTALYRNRKHPHIKFIFEHECSTPVLFLDIKIWRENNKLKTSMYRKQSRYDDFNCNASKKSGKVSYHWQHLDWGSKRPFWWFYDLPVRKQ